MGITAVLYLIGMILAGVEAFQTRSFGWGGVAFVAAGLFASSL